jgi:D-alanyl-D-alanine carboxypeptidase
MRRVRLEPAYGLRGFAAGCAAVIAATSLFSTSADARYYRHLRYVRQASYHRPVGHYRLGGGNYAPQGAAIVVDGNSGSVLYESNAESPRHPASITKIMTLYLLFERLEAGRIKLDSQLKVSEHASEQAPTKLGLKPGQTIAVEDAIKAAVTKSANDAAVTIAENLGGDEPSFARMMTEKARALGMTGTTYVNASGLPDDDQITTARDQAILGRAIQERFPRFYKYFATEEFVYHGHAMRNHNRLLGVVNGVDGIKTGYTNASGFNLVTSVHRDGRFIVAVVLGGQSASARDARMRELINVHIREASLRHTAPAIVEHAVPRSETRVASAEKSEARSEPRNEGKSEPKNEPKAQSNGEARPVAFAKRSLAAHTDTTAASAKPGANNTTNANAAAGSTDPIQPTLVKTITYRTAPVQAGSLAPMPALAPAAAPPASAQARTAAPPAQAAQLPQLPVPPSTIVVASADPASVATTSRADGAKTDNAKTDGGRSDVAKIDSNKIDSNKLDIGKSDGGRSEVVKTEPAKPEPAKSEVAKSEVAKSEVAKSDVAKSDVVKSDPVQAVVPKPEPIKTAMAKADPPKSEPSKADPAYAEPSAAKIRARGGWLIQIGAFEGEDEAKEHLTDARHKLPAMLAAADPFTERVQKGDKSLYRARFAGFDRSAAEAACKQLKRSDIACMTVRN